MKKVNLKNKPSSLFVKGITTLSLSLALQGRACLNQGGIAGQIATKMSDQQFCATIENTKDISCSTDEKGRNIFYAAIKYNQPKKIEIILEQYARDKTSNVPHKSPDFINAPDSKSKNTPFEEAIIQGYGSIIDILLKDQYINIKTKHPISANTTLHVAIESKQSDIAKKLINRFKEEAQELLFAQNNAGDTPLHLAMAHKLADVQSQLINLVTEDKLLMPNTQEKTVIDVAIQHNQQAGIDLIKKLSKEQLSAKNKNEETLLHRTAYHNNLDVFKLVLQQISNLGGPEEVIKQLSEKTQAGKTVWQYIYLSALSVQPVYDSTNIKMFENAINTVKDKLTPMARDAILKDIDSQQASTLKGKISKQYADKLRKIVNDAKPAPPAA